jgi:glutaredoxin
MQISPRLLFTIAGLVFAAAVFWPFGQGGQASAVSQARALVGQERVILFSAPWCGYCDRLRADFQRHGVAFAEQDIESSAAGQRAWRGLGGRGVPLTLVDRAVHTGYDPGLAPRLAGDRR